MSQIFNILDDKVVINKLALRYLEGSITHAGQLTVVGAVNLGSSLVVNNTISADTINVTTLKVKNLVTDTGSLGDGGQWSVNEETDLIGKGFNWTHGHGNVKLVYRDGGRLWANADFDLDPTKSYKIDNVPVLSASELGPQVTKSNLKEVGALKSLNVVGNASVGEFAYFMSGNARLGINTDQPNGSIGIVENDVEIVINSPDYGTGQIGTYTNHDFNIITDNTVRITAKNNGEIHIGNEATKTGVLRVFGTIHADNLVTDTRLDRSSPLEFKTGRGQEIYGLGLQWIGTGDPRQLVMVAGPDRLFSTESIDIARGQAYYANGKAVLSENTLGESVTQSTLTSVGSLESLTVQGDTKLIGELAVHGTAFFKIAAIKGNLNTVSVNEYGVNATTNVAVKVAEADVFYADGNEIVVGNRANTRRQVKMFGPVSVNVNTPDTTVDLEVQGDVSFGGKKFITGNTEPKQGVYTKGDICWNQDPGEHNFVGWICVASGTPGTWLPFGAITR
jgi:hypothetical protein